MSEKEERETRAFEALVVSLLRKDCDPEKVQPEDLPKLTEKEQAALDALGPDLIERLWKERRITRPSQQSTDTSVSNEAREHAMNRAEDMSDETAEELRIRREEILNRLRQKREAK